MRELLVESYLDSEIITGFGAKLITATGARTTAIIEISPPSQPPLWKPPTGVQIQRARGLNPQHSQ